MLMLRSTHERLIAEAQHELMARRQEVRDLVQACQGAHERAERAEANYHELSLRVAEFADRALPPKRSETVKQPLSIDAADGAVVKKLKGIK